MSANLKALTTGQASGNAWRRFGLLTQANFLMYVRNRAAIFWVIFFPIAYMLLFGAIYGGQRIDPNNPNSVKVISFMIPGLVVMSLMSGGIIGNAGTMANWRERGVLRRIQTTPLPIWQLLMSRILVLSVVMVVQAFLLIGIGVIVFQASFDTVGLLEAIPLIILSAIMCMAIGQSVAALVSKAETVQIVCQLIFFPLLFLGGLFIPMNQLPEGLQAVGKFLPSGLVGDIVRAPMLSGFNTGKVDLTNLPFLVSLIGVVIYLLVFVAISARFFKWN